MQPPEETPQPSPPNSPALDLSTSSARRVRLNLIPDVSEIQPESLTDEERTPIFLGEAKKGILSRRSDEYLTIRSGEEEEQKRTRSIVGMALVLCTAGAALVIGLLLMFLPDPAAHSPPKPSKHAPPPTPAICKFTPGEQMFISGMFDCWKRVPFGEKQQKDTLNNILSLMPLYTFLDLSAHSSGGRLPVNFNIWEHIEGMFEGNYTGKFYEFHTEIATDFLQLRDFGTAYYLPPEMGRMLLCQPFGLQEVGDKVIISAIFKGCPAYRSLEQIQRMHGLSDEDVLGAEVVVIRQCRVVPHCLRSYTKDAVGGIKDPYARQALAYTAFDYPDRGGNPVMLRPGAYSVRMGWGGVAPLPQANEVDEDWSFKIKGKMYNMTAEWGTIVPSEVPDGPSLSPLLWQRELAPVVYKPPSLDAKEGGEGKWRGFKEIELPYEGGRSEYFRLFQTASQDGEVQFVLRIRLFRLEGGTLQDLWNGVVQKLHEEAGKLPGGVLSTLLLDLSGNSGGDHCVMRTILDGLLLNEEGPGGKDAHYYDFPYSRLGGQLSRLSIPKRFERFTGAPLWQGGRYLNTSSETPFCNCTGWMTPGQTRQRGTQYKKFSSTFYRPGCHGEWPAVPNGWVDKVIIMSRADCLDECAIFTSTLQQLSEAGSLNFTFLTAAVRISSLAPALRGVPAASSLSVSYASGGITVNDTFLAGYFHDVCGDGYGTKKNRVCPPPIFPTPVHATGSAPWTGILEADLFLTVSEAYPASALDQNQTDTLPLDFTFTGATCTFAPSDIEGFFNVTHQWQTALNCTA